MNGCCSRPRGLADRKPRWGGGGRCVWCVGRREEGGVGSVFYFSQLLWKELQELKSKEQRWNNVQDLTKASALLCSLLAVVGLSRGSVPWVISHTQMLGRALAQGEGRSWPALHTPGVQGDPALTRRSSQGGRNLWQEEGSLLPFQGAFPEKPSWMWLPDMVTCDVNGIGLGYQWIIWGLFWEFDFSQEISWFTDKLPKLTLKMKV